MIPFASAFMDTIRWLLDGFDECTLQTGAPGEALSHRLDREAFLRRWESRAPEPDREDGMPFMEAFSGSLLLEAYIQEAVTGAAPKLDASLNLSVELDAALAPPPPEAPSSVFMSHEPRLASKIPTEPMMPEWLSLIERCCEEEAESGELDAVSIESLQRVLEAEEDAREHLTKTVEKRPELDVLIVAQALWSACEAQFDYPRVSRLLMLPLRDDGEAASFLHASSHWHVRHWEAALNVYLESLEGPVPHASLHLRTVQEALHAWGQRMVVLRVPISILKEVIEASVARYQLPEMMATRIIESSKSGRFHEPPPISQRLPFVVHGLFSGPGKPMRRLATSYLEGGTPMLLAASAEEARLWGLGYRERTCLGIFTGHSGGITAVGFQGDLPLTGGEDGTLKVWDISKGSYNASIPASPMLNEVVAINGCDDCVWCATSDGVVRGWDPRQRHDPMHALWDHTEAVTQILTFEEKGMVITSSLDRTVRIWDVRKGMSDRKGHAECLKVLPGINTICPIGLGGGVLAVQNDFTELVVYGLETAMERPKYTREAHAREWKALTVTSRGLVVCGSDDGVVRQWDQSGHCTSEFVTHGRAVTTLCDAGHDRVVSGSVDGSLRVWDMESGKIEAVMKGHEEAVRCVESVGSWLVSIDEEETTVRAWHLGGPPREEEEEDRGQTKQQQGIVPAGMARREHDGGDDGQEGSAMEKSEKEEEEDKEGKGAEEEAAALPVEGLGSEEPAPVPYSR